MKRLLPVLILCALVSCEKVEEADKPAGPEAVRGEMLDLNEAVVAAPDGVVSTTADIDVTFGEPVIPSHLEGAVLDENPFTFSPEIRGHAEWVSRRLLRFVPEGRLPAGARIEGVLHGKVAFGESRNVNDLKLSFKVAEQEVLSISADFAPVPDVKNGVRYSGFIELAEPVDAVEVADDISLTVDQKQVDVEVRPGDGPRRVEIRSEVIERIDRGRNVTVRLPKRYSPGRDPWVYLAHLPAAGVFRVLDHFDMTGRDSEVLTYGFRFNEPIKEGIDLSGFVTVEAPVPYEVRVNGKYLLIEGDFTPGRLYGITIAEGFPSAYGTKLPGEYVESFTLENLKPEVRWLDDGVYMPADNEYKLQLESVNVSRIRVSVMEIYPQNVGFFLQRNALVDPSQDGRGYYGRGYNDLNRVGETIFGEKLTIAQERNEWIKTELDLTSIFKGKTSSVFVIKLAFDKGDLAGRCTNSRDDLGAGDLYYEDDDYYSDPCEPGYYYRHGESSKLLVSSNVGLTVKVTDSATHVFAADVLTARPLSGLKLDLYTYENKLIESRSTDSGGYAFFDRTGAYILGSHESGIAVMSDRHPRWQINNFEVGGAAGGVDGTDVFAYADRGVHRPGDTIHLSAIVRIRGEVPPQRLPVVLRVTNPLGQMVHEAREQCGRNGHVHFPFETSPDDPTGEWPARLKIGDLEFTKRLRIETVKPFRLKVNVEVPGEIRAPETVVRGKIEAEYLFGTPASGHRTEVEMTLRERRFSPSEYPHFTFSTPTRSFRQRHLSAFKGTLDESGSRGFRAELEGVGEAPGLVQAILETKVFETGGGFTTQRTPLTIYPRAAFVGIKDVFGGRSALIGEKYEVPIVVVGPDGEPVAGHRLKVSLYVNSSHWWWEYGRGDRVDFRRMESTYPAGEHTYISQDEPIAHSFSVEDQGRHLIEVTDEESGHRAGVFFYGSRWGYEPVEEEEPSFLRITSNKNVYGPGDRASITFETPERGMALLTVEQGDRLIRKDWKAVEGGRTSFEFAITEEMIPNCYASVSLIQPHNQNTNDVPMRTYGVKTLYIEDPSTHLILELTVPDETGPEEELAVEVTSRASRPASYTIAVVDEGLLDITAFETPSPWEHFYEKIRLGVATFDNYDQILGILRPDMDRFLSIGGAMMEEERLKRADRTRVRRFRPVAIFEGPIEIEPGQTVSTALAMPNYVGSVRVMVIGAAGDSYASLEETVPVRQALMVLPTVPRVARPGDRFELPVSVFSMDSTIAEAEVSISLSGALEAAGPTVSGVEFEGPGERHAAFSVEVGDTVGAAEITVAAASGSHSADYEVDLPVTSPNPHYTEVTDTAAVEGAPVTLVPRRIGIGGTNRARIAFTGAPDIHLQKRLSFLIRYPYGCIEQIVSSAFAQIFLPELTDLKPHQRRAVTDHVNSTIRELAGYRLGDGFSFWPVSRRRGAKLSDWGSTYAGHFLTVARAKGYHVPEDLYSHWLEGAESRAKIVDRENHRYQAYRLFALALAGRPHMGAMNLMRENWLGSLDPLSRMLLAASYHLGGVEDVARSIRESSRTDVESYRELGGTYGSALRDRAFIAYLLVEMGDVRTASVLLRDVAASFRSGGWYSTQESAMAVLSVGAYYSAVPSSGGDISFRMTVGDGPERMLKLEGYQMTLDLEDAWDKQVTIVNESGGTLYVTLLEEGVPLESRLRAESSGIQLNRGFFDDRGRPIDVADMPQGVPFWVVYTVESGYGATLEDVALSSVFPSGWEIINTRLADEGLPDWIRELRVTEGDYMDVRDDRVNWFFDLGPRRLVFATRLSPTFEGTFVLPPVVAEAMYSPRFYARIAGGTVRVE